MSNKLVSQTAWQTNFQKAQLQSVSIFFKLVHPCLSLYCTCYLHFYFISFFLYTGNFYFTRFCDGSHTLNFGTPRDMAPLSLSSNVFERRTSSGSERFSLLIYRDATKFVLLSVFTLKEKFCLRICSKSRLKSAKSPLPVDVHRSKTSLLKLHNNWHLDSIHGYTPRSLRCTTKGGGCCPRAFLLLVM